MDKKDKAPPHLPQLKPVFTGRQELIKPFIITQESFFSSR